jgi:hypothetical protein
MIANFIKSQPQFEVFFSPHFHCFVSYDNLKNKEMHDYHFFVCFALFRGGQRRTRFVPPPLDGST